MGRPATLAFAFLALGSGVAFWGLRDMQRPGFRGDGVGYYAPLASLVFDGDLDLRNELAHLNPRYVQAAFMTPDGRLGDPFPVGAALLWAPAVVGARHFTALAALDAPLSERVPTPHPAFAARFARAVQWTNMWLVLVGGGALAAALAPALGALRSAAATLAAVLGTPVLYYTLVDPSYGHAASFFAASLLVAAVWIDSRARLPLWILGFLWGLVSLVRAQDALLGLLLGPRLVEEWRMRLPRENRPGVAATLRCAATLGLGVGLPAAVAFLPQALFWWRIYGRPLLIPPGPDLGPLWKPQVLPLLFSTWNGILLWSPLLLVGIGGLALLPSRSLKLAALACVVLEIYSSAILLDWWGGSAFGPRRLVSLAPLAAVGLAHLLHRQRELRWRAGLIGLLLVLLCAVNVRAAQYKMYGLLPANPGSAADYVRHHLPGSKRALPYGFWDYPRLFAESIEAERLLRVQKRRERAGTR